MQLPLAYLDASAIEEVPTDLWRKVFNTVGWPTSLASKRDAFTHADVLAAFERDTPTDDLLQAVEVLNDLGTESGRDAIVSAMSDRRVPIETLPMSVGEREFALHLFLAQREDASLAEVFVRAQIQVQEGADHRRYNEFLGKEARTVANLKAKSDALRDETLRYCRENDLGDHVQIRAFEDDGAYVFHVIRSHHTKKPLAVVPGRLARATIEYRPVHGDILRYDAALGRLRIAARASSVVEFYRSALGRVLFEDTLFFTGDPVCSLKILQDQGRRALENHSVPGIGRVWMTECLWERGDRDLLHIRSTDCFRNIDELNLPLAEGQLIQAKLKLEVADRSMRPVSVNIRVPSRIEVNQKRHERIIEQFLDTVGIRNVTRSSAEIDLWSLYPWRHPYQVWRALFGKETDSLAQSGVLVPVQLTSIPNADHADAGRVHDAHIASVGEFYGVSRVPEIPSRSLSSTDLDGWELNPEHLRLYLRSRLGIADVSEPWDGRELFDLGTIRMGDVLIHLMYALRRPPPGTGDIMRARAAGKPSVLLLPSSHLDDSELPKVLLQSALPTRDTVIRQAVSVCALTSAVSAVFTAPENTRIVVDTTRGQIWVDGLEIPGLRPGTHPFRLVEALAKTSPTPVSTEALSMQLSGARKDGDTPARQAKRAARASINEAMTNAGRTLDDDPFPSVPTGYYRCIFQCYVR